MKETEEEEEEEKNTRNFRTRIFRLGTCTRAGRVLFKLYESENDSSVKGGEAMRVNELVMVE